MSVTDNLLKNIEAEIGMVRELSGFMSKLEMSRANDRRVLIEMINSLIRRIKLLNGSVPELLKVISLDKKLPTEKKITSVEVDEFENVKTEDNREVVIRKKDRVAFLGELNINADLIKRLKKRKLVKKEKEKDFRKPSLYGKMANRFFFNISERWIRRGNFKSLSLDLRRSNLNILTTTYVSMALLSIFISIFVGIFVFLFFMFFSLGIDFPFITQYAGSYLERFIKTFWIIVAVPLLTGLSFYFFPAAEKSSIGKKIDQELPFVVIHMASISGSGIEPGEIFKIVGTSDEYKFTKKEIRKVLNQTNLYGYDLTNALRNVALATPSSKLSELLNGIGVTINSGGDIKSFFEKRAESLLLSYRLEREKYTKTAETFMDIYISIVIAAPMILLMLLIMISVSGIQTGFNLNQMTIAIIGIVGIINILFLTFLHLKQPVY